MIKETYYVALDKDGEYYYINPVLNFLLTTTDLKKAHKFKDKEHIKQYIEIQFENGEWFSPCSIETIEVSYELKFKQYL